MKRYIIILETLGIFIFMYLFGSFVANSFLLDEWDGIGRFFMGLMAIAASITNIVSREYYILKK